jgi:hypothetical protein
MYLFTFGVVVFLLCVGIIGDIIYAKYNKAVMFSGLKNGIGESPKAISIKNKSYQTVVSFLSSGVSPDMWVQKQSLLEHNLGAEIEEIRASGKHQCVDVIINKFKLPKKLSFSGFEGELSLKPHQYPIGRSSNGSVVSSLYDCPHILIGGTTGMGKSTSFKLILYSLLSGTPKDQIEFKLLDLKRGLEVSDFKSFSNVDISKDEFEACFALELVSKEMAKRYKMLESRGDKLLDPVKHNLPRIVVAVDEASVIFGKTKSSSNISEAVKKSREKCEEIAKLGRAAGIHLILATQRATSSSIDTSTLDNLEGRLCFRTQSVSGSNAILGNKSGTEIPDVPGRAIGRKGTKTEMIQVPFMTDQELSEKCEVLARERGAVKVEALSSQTSLTEHQQIKLRDVTKI